jgi:uracil-DNA glycosylase
MLKIENQIPKDYLKLIDSRWKEEDRVLLNKNLKLIFESEIICPKREWIFRALELCPVDQVKGVILGQDPYPTRGHAHGLAFSTEDFVQPFPKSLRNILVELKRSVNDYEIPLTGNLSHWAAQGVLLLNSALTTREGEANAHKNLGWEQFTQAIIDALANHHTGLVGMFWGNPAQAKAINWGDEHLVLKTSHPSPLSVYRGFAGCDHFNLANDYLTKQGEKVIKW